MRSSEPIVEKGLGPVSQSQPWCAETEPQLQAPAPSAAERLVEALEEEWDSSAQDLVDRSVEARILGDLPRADLFLEASVIMRARITDYHTERQLAALNAPPQPHVAPEGEGNSVSQSQPCADGERAARTEAEPSGPAIRNALRLAMAFAEAEAEQRADAGGSMSDYITEAEEVADTVRGALAEAEKIP